jgi:rhodanese-related sulfurtransferase
MSRNFLIPVIVLAVLLLAAAALFAYSQRPGAGATGERLGLVGRTIVRGEDQVNVPDLAQRIVADRRDFVLVDLRPTADFVAEHIPGARNLSLTEILQPDVARATARGRTLILYDAGATEAAQGAALLRVVGIDAQALRGGFDHWLRFTLDPSSELPGAPPILSRAERQAIACYFQGEYMPTAGLPVQPAPAAYTPPVAPVVPAAAAAPPADPLGLGLGLGLGTVTPVAPAPSPAPTDPLGLGLGLGIGTVAPPAPLAAPAADPLGLGLGLGVGTVAPPAAPVEAPQPAEPPPRRPGLRVGQGC